MVKFLQQLEFFIRVFGNKSISHIYLEAVGGQK